MEWSGLYVCLRITDQNAPVDILDTVFAEHVDDTREYLVVHEVGEGTEKPHSHSLLPLNKSLEAFRLALNRLGLKGNEVYSLKKADPDKIDSMVDYMCKGTGTGSSDAPKVVRKSPFFGDDVISTAHHRYWAVNAALRENKRKKRKRDDPAAVQILELCENLAAREDKAVSEDDIIDVTLEWYKGNKFCMNEMQMKGVVTWVSYNLNDESNRIQMLRNALKFKC